MAFLCTLWHTPQRELMLFKSLTKQWNSGLASSLSDPTLEDIKVSSIKASYLQQTSLHLNCSSPTRYFSTTPTWLSFSTELMLFKSLTKQWNSVSRLLPTRPDT
ncbi:unnamed protein product [Gordionus sp. m RMFG-2023]